MSIPTENWRKWEGKIVDGKFPLQKWVSSSDHSAVFITARGPSGQKAAIKLISAANLDADVQLSRWAETTKLSHPHLIRLFDCGRVQMEDTPILYAVMEFADENLAEVLPVRPLTANEALDTLRPAAEELASLHQAGLVQGRIKPSNILAVQNQLKLAPDGIRKSGAPADKRNSSYDAPEIASTGFTAASDMFSLGLTLLAVLTQKEPGANLAQAASIVPEAISQPLRGIIEQCLQIDPAKRGTAKDALRQISPGAAQSQTAPVPRVQPTPVVNRTVVEKPRSKRGFLIPVVVIALVLLIWAGSRMFNRSSSAPAGASTPDARSGTSSGENSNGNVPIAPAAQAGSGHGSVANQVLPDVSPGALHTIRGHIKVNVQVNVDASGNVSEAKLTSSGPSAYFSSRALKAAQQWKFIAPQDNGKPAPSQWILRFQFSRGGAQVTPLQARP